MTPKITRRLPKAHDHKHPPWIEWLEDWAIRFFDYILIAFIFCLIVGVLYILTTQIGAMFSAAASANVHVAVDLVLFMLILLELFMILVTYLKYHHIKVMRIVEIALISVVREVIFKVFEVDAMKLFGLAALIVSLAVVYYIERKYQVDPKLEAAYRL
ncbi:MAG: phosphate-starvation-inducible PsiE family protein [Candidatus Woesearchaeota archaeon]|nr:phosphate-starvation-inducible PsiE family protein [Candidatus Woesearchaeota archaeon]